MSTHTNTNHPIEANQRLEFNKQLVTRFFEDVWHAKNVEALPNFIAEDYIQHNPNLKNGRQAFSDFLVDFFQQLPHAKFTVVRLIAENDWVMTHSLFQPHDQDRGMAVVDIFRLVDGVMVEHWDVKESVPEITQSGHPMV